MNRMIFNDLADFLQHGREVEFTYKDRQYSITNHSGFWYLCDDTGHFLLETICHVSEGELLVSKIANTMIDGLTIQQIFDRQLYDHKQLCIL